MTVTAIDPCHRLVARVAPDALPDYLKDWDPATTPGRMGEQR